MWTGFNRVCFWLELCAHSVSLSLSPKTRKVDDFLGHFYEAHAAFPPLPDPPTLFGRRMLIEPASLISCHFALLPDELLDHHPPMREPWPESEPMDPSKLEEMYYTLIWNK